MLLPCQFLRAWSSNTAAQVLTDVMSQQSGMKALVVRQLGNPVPSPTEKKPYAVTNDHPTPQYLAPNAVRIRIAASGLNFADALQVMVSLSGSQAAIEMRLCLVYLAPHSAHTGPVSGKAQASLHPRIRSLWKSHRSWQGCANSCCWRLGMHRLPQ